ncbi:MAG: ABC transporter ATP-binding protein [Candidatus Dactylopiibacterium carminicum]|uniref:ABC transporter ATP-binding protein n=1 Tax=Candidatus Dactylopiibacterium carminicum TaxID=857335 RepID=A0A272EWC8_9RHOO|nr:VWA domain-containing protein [Candidatus Dactylopiibacterium carminicum]KAF7599567.1 ABC transporter ATP-binding protein [Candidatus Dactylopiibacterium carminicum]PAS94409.1 MAG: ABC transporter ATP-binding protein [Candidatus Dactylopiibacterium carminicum]PAS96428.1 MAG: ABC transporter ATP-binding protein [Candidatus Dactylopiibacterium carminicum]PAS99570.1 MAG: ABC transporter ATP-binding protein [Candidatus Dactylopiibacterium carminicum]
MTFQWPLALWALLLVPAFIGLYVLILRRRKRVAVRYANLALVREALGPGNALRRHVPPLLMLLALALMLLAASRPVMTLTLPIQQQTVILAMDVSGSMRATDVQPNRIEASQAAAKAFIKAQPASTKVGIIAFAGTASVVQPPTRNHEDLIAAIDRFQLQRGTAIGSGLLLSLATLLPDSGIDIAQMLYGDDARRGDNQPIGQDKVREPFEPVPPGSNTSSAIILLTDGQRTTGPDSLDAAKMAAERGVRVYTVGIGTREGETIGFEGWSMRVQLDENTLRKMAEMTLGEYFHASTAPDLTKVYEALNSRIAFEKKQTEISGLIAALAAALISIAAALSLWWHGRAI